MPFGFGEGHLGRGGGSEGGSAVDRLSGLKHAGDTRIAIQLGSGLGALVDALADVDAVDYGALAGFPQPTVAGHRGRVVAGQLAGVPVLCLQGRVHLYEGGPAAAVNAPIRTLRAFGIRLLVLTNAAGAIAPHFEPGSVVLVSDHINALGKNPLVGPNADDVGPRFPDMSVVYDRELRDLVKKTGAAAGLRVHEGVYLATLGPSFETPAEIRAFKAIGADLVGMSTVPEAISARHAGLRVLGFSAVTNRAAGQSGRPLSHDETLAVGAVAGEKLAKLLGVVLPEVHHAL
ncbi:MAG: purine-nucleoside phosphorylase [Geminicoccaceae bacterium]|nr:MAG: purine-nucleoside phosphorylase [Geminicoccaceae bacterium]